MYAFPGIVDVGLYVREFTSHLIDGLDGHYGRDGRYGGCVQESFVPSNPCDPRLLDIHLSSFFRCKIFHAKHYVKINSVSPDSVPFSHSSKLLTKNPSYPLTTYKKGDS